MRRAAAGTSDNRWKSNLAAAPVAARRSYQTVSEPQELGSILVAAVFDAFLEIAVHSDATEPLPEKEGLTTA
jgi:hypothetical protein